MLSGSIQPTRLHLIQGPLDSFQRSNDIMWVDVSLHDVENGRLDVLRRRSRPGPDDSPSGAEGHFDGYVWTFAKGKQERGSNAEETALREVKEETGYTATIVAKLPGSYKGGTGATEHFIMRPVGDPGPFEKKETQAIAWIGFDEAATRIAQTTNEIGRNRDQAVLQTTIQFMRKPPRSSTP